MATGASTPLFGRFPLRELTGVEEYAVTHTGAAAAIALLDPLLEPGKAKQLTASERDGALLEVLRLTRGPRIESTLTCTSCRAPFDVSFSAADLMPPAEPSAAAPLPDGTFETADGGRFRIPAGEDELAVAGLPPEDAALALRERCVIAEGTGGLAAIEEALESVAPILDREVRTVCPECSSEQAARFDLQHYVLQSLIQEQTRLALDIHSIASAYGWSPAEILSLRRSMRRRLVELISDAAGRSA